MREFKIFIIILATICCLVGATHFVLSDKGMTETTTAKVIDIKYLKGNDMYLPVLKYQVDGKTYIFTDSVAINPNVLGSTTDVHYDKNDPSRVMLNVNQQWGKILLFIIIYPITLFIMAGLISMVNDKYRRKQKEDLKNEINNLN